MAVYISIVALIFSGVAIYCSWIVHKQNQKVLAAQKKTELLQKIDTEIFKIKSLEVLLQEMVFMFKDEDDKEYHDFLIKNLDKNTLNNIINIDKGTEGLRKEIKEYIKEMSDTRESFRKIDININPVLFEEKLQHANRQLLSAEHIISEAEKMKKQRQDAKDEYLKLKKKMLNNKKSD